MRNRLMAGMAVLVLLGFLLGLGVGKRAFSGNGVPSAYAGVVEQPSDLAFPAAAPSRGPGQQTLAFGNTGRNIQQLALRGCQPGDAGDSRRVRLYGNERCTRAD